MGERPGAALSRIRARPDYRRLWGEPDARAWERAHEHYLAQFDRFSDIQERARRCRCPSWKRNACPPESRNARARAADAPTPSAAYGRYTLDLARGLADRGIDDGARCLGPSAERAQQEAEASALPGLRLIETRAAARLDRARPNGSLPTRPRRSRRLAAGPGADLGPAARAGACGMARAVRRRSLSVAHSCVATWWRAVRAATVARRFPLARRVSTAGGSAGSRRRDRAQPQLRRRASRDLRRRLRACCGRPQRPPDDRRDGGGASARAVRVHRRAGSGTRARTSRRSTARRRSRRRRCSRPGPSAGPERRARSRSANLRPLGNAATTRIAARYAEARDLRLASAATSRSASAVLEAAQAGCALVLSDIPTFRELWDGAALFVAPDGEATALARLTRLLRRPGWPRRNSAHGARARAAATRWTRWSTRTAGASTARCCAAPVACGVRRDAGRLFHALAGRPAGTTATRISCAGSLRELARARARGRAYSSRRRLEPRQPARGCTGARRARCGSRRLFPSCRRATYERRSSIRPKRLDGADLVIVHEWNDPALVAALGRSAARAAAASRCCSTTRITARSAIRRRCVRFDLIGL